VLLKGEAQRQKAVFSKMFSKPLFKDEAPAPAAAGGDPSAAEAVGKEMAAEAAAAEAAGEAGEGHFLHIEEMK